MRTSYSAIDTYNTCPLKYKFKEVDKIKEPKSAEQFFGTLMHSVMQYIYTPGFSSPTREQAIDFFGKNWSGDLFENELDARNAFVQGVEMIGRHYDNFDPNQAVIVNLESRFAIEIKNPDDPNEIHILSGIIDRIDKTPKGYEIIDYKTARKMPDQAKIDNDLQLSIYLKAFLKQYPDQINNLENVTVSLFYLKHGVKLSSHRTREQLDDLDRLFISTIHDIEAQKFEPKLSPLCNWCGFKKLCPMWRHEFKEERKFETDEVRQAVNEFIEIKERATRDRKRSSELQETLESYMQQEGIARVFGDTKIIEQTTRKTYRYDMGKLREILEPQRKWEDVIKIDQTTLKKVASGLPFAMQRMIDETKGLDKETKSFTVKKRTGLEEDIEL